MFLHRDEKPMDLARDVLARMLHHVVKMGSNPVGGCAGETRRFIEKNPSHATVSKPCKSEHVRSVHSKPCNRISDVSWYAWYNTHMSDLRLDPRLTRIDPSAFIAFSALVLGDVAIGAEVSIWFQAVIRGDTDHIRVGARTNIQDGSVLHADAGVPCTIGNEVTVGHRAIVHGAIVGDRCLIGMAATVMNHAQVGEECIVGANALVREGMVIPPGHLVLGVPAKVVRPLTDPEKQMLRMSAAHYVEAGQAYKKAGFEKQAGWAASQR